MEPVRSAKQVVQAVLAKRITLVAADFSAKTVPARVALVKTIALVTTITVATKAIVASLLPAISVCVRYVNKGL